jgi:hypothetical protein
VTERDQLAKIGCRDLLRAFRLQWVPGLPWLLRKPSLRFADEALAFDAAIGRGGLLAGADFLLENHARTLRIEGEIAPPEGPLLVVSNHPGLVDAMAVWRAVGRQDLWTVAADRELLRLLPNTSSRLLPAEPFSASFRAMLERLAEGGAVLTFPAGKIELDPALFPEAGPVAADWGVFRRRVPGLKVLRARVSGVISKRAYGLPLPFRKPADRSWAAASLQVAFPGLRKVDVVVRLESLEADSAVPRATL